MSQVIKYFGFGANRHPQMIEALTGRPKDELVGQPATIEGFSLALQALHQVSNDTIGEAPSPRSILSESWGHDFMAHVLISGLYSKVAGTVWDLSVDEHERIKDWQLVDLGWQKETRATALTSDKLYIPVVTETLMPGQDVLHTIDGTEYDTWSNPQAMVMNVANNARLDYDARSSS